MKPSRSSKYKLIRLAPNGLRLIFPLLLGAFLITIIVKTMYFGGRRESLAAQAESALIRWSLGFASAPARADDGVVTISANDSDLQILELSPESGLRDLHIKEYATVLEEVAQSNPRWIVVSWLTYAHPMTPEYLSPITDTIDRLKIHDKVMLAVNLYATGTISPEFMSRYNIVEARDCYYEINSFCTVSQEWTWMPQQIMNRFFSRRQDWVVSDNLPHTLPNILLNLPSPGSIREHSFLDLHSPGRINIKPESIVFIGNNATQHLSFRDNKDALQKTYVAASNSRRTLLKDGTPWHSFWASMSSMFLNQETISVAPTLVTRVMIGILIIAILLSIKILGTLSLAPFLLISLITPLINMLSVSFLRLYIPVMDLIIAGLIVFTAATFISVALSSYRKWRLTAQEDLAVATADIKENFIHLISHNLNTPIAQLRGLMDIIASTNEDNSQLHEASTKLEYVRIITQCVLNTSSLPGLKQQQRAQHARDLFAEFMEQETAFFRRTNTSITLTPSFNSEDRGEIWFYKFNLDRNLAKAIILNSAIMITLRERATKVRIDVSAINDEPADPRGMRVQISAETTSPNAHLMDAEFCITALRRYLRITEELTMVSIESVDQGLLLTFNESTIQPQPN
jgi:signal transduction histidine kinase